MVPDRNGIANNACYLNGTSSYITINTINDAYVDGFSISVWVYITEAQGEYARILDFGNGSYSDNICLYFIWSNYLTYQGYNAASVAGGRGIGDLTHNAWHHVCITSDSSGNISAYLDGLTDGTSLTGVLRNVVRTSNFIGRSNWAGEPLFKGYLDNMRFYNRALTANEVLQLFSNDQL